MMTVEQADAEIVAFATRHGVNADEIRRFVAEAEPGNPLWPNVIDYLAEHKVQASKADMQALSDATGAALTERQRRPAIAEPAPAPETAQAPQPAPAAAEAPETPPEPPQAPQEPPVAAKPAASRWAAVVAAVNADRPHTWSP